MELHLKNRKILISGAASGIGKAIAESLAAEGAFPVLLDRDGEALERTVKALQKSGYSCGHGVAELEDIEQVETVVKQLQQQHGQFYGLVNNAGLNDQVGLKTGSVTDFVRSYRANTVHYFHLTQLVLSDLTALQGAIVNISSKVAETGQGGTSGYAAANGARNALTREWAVELLPHKIRVNAVIVAEALTPLYQRWIGSFDQPEQKMAEIVAKIPLGNRMTKTSEIADTVCFLLSDRSAHTTGQLIHIDGGYTHLDRSL